MRDLRASGERAMLAGDFESASLLWNRLLALLPSDSEALFHLGNIARSSGRSADAVQCFERALRGSPRHPGILTNLGLALQDDGTPASAEPFFRQVVAQSPHAFEPRANLAQNLFLQGRHAEALVEFNAIVSRTGDVPATIWAHRAACALETGDVALAEASLRSALQRDGTHAKLHANLAVLRMRQQRMEEAESALTKACELEPENAAYASDLLYCRQSLARWTGLDELRNRQADSARAARTTAGAPISPFNFATFCDDPALQRAVAERYARSRGFDPAPRRSRTRSEPRRLAFVSYDLYGHPVGRFLVELLEHLDRTRFTPILYGVGDIPDDALHRRLVAGAEEFHRVPRLDAPSVARDIRDNDVDVLFDLNGYTGPSLLDVCLRRPAPMQVNYLGYTGTMGSSAYDFLVTDRFCIPADSRRHYAERPLYLDPCYLPAMRATPHASVSRGDYGFDSDDIVLCAFAATYKILPEMFTAWMALLRRHDRAILWLRDAGEQVGDRLRFEAARRGVSAARLRFAPQEPLERYRARLALADAFLDTVPFGAHTTVSDALSAGVPVVTLAGRSFAARASASQVCASGLGHVTDDLDAYAAAADRGIAEARLRARRGERRAKDERSDIGRYARQFEEALRRAWQAL